MTVHMASFGYELLAALEELLDAFDESEGDGKRAATITPEHHAEVKGWLRLGAANPRPHSDLRNDK
jgi:hypothetical protein